MQRSLWQSLPPLGLDLVEAGKRKLLYDLAEDVLAAQPSVASNGRGGLRVPGFSALVSDVRQKPLALPVPQRRP